MSQLIGKSIVLQLRRKDVEVTVIREFTTVHGIRVYQVCDNKTTRKFFAIAKFCDDLYLTTTQTN